MGAVVRIDAGSLLPAFAFGVLPVGLNNLSRTPDGERILRNVIGDTRRSADVGSLSNLDRRDQCSIAADKRSLFDDGPVLVDTVVVTGYGAGAHVHLCANLRITEIGEVIRLGAAPESGLLQFHEVPDVSAFFYPIAGAKVRVGTKLRSLFDA